MRLFPLHASTLVYTGHLAFVAQQRGAQGSDSVNTLVDKFRLGPQDRIQESESLIDFMQQGAAAPPVPRGCSTSTRLFQKSLTGAESRGMCGVWRGFPARLRPRIVKVEG